MNPSGKTSLGSANLRLDLWIYIFQASNSFIATDNQLERILEKNLSLSRFLDVLSDDSSTS